MQLTHSLKRHPGFHQPLNLKRNILVSSRYFQMGQRVPLRLGYCPAHVPAVHLYDAPMSVIAMRYLAPPHVILRGGIIAGRVYPQLAAHVGEYLATTLFSSSALGVGCEALRKARQAFGPNEAMCAFTEQVIFTEPYAEASNNHWTSPQLDADAAALRGGAAVHVALGLPTACKRRLGFNT
jgi:5-methylthioribose kinase